MVGSPVEAKRATCILGKHQPCSSCSEQRMARIQSTPASTRNVSAPLLRRTTTVFLLQDYNGDVTRDSEMDVGCRHCTLSKTQDVMAEVAAEPHSSLSSLRRHRCTPLDLGMPLHQGCPDGLLLCPWHVPSGQVPLAQT